MPRVTARAHRRRSEWTELHRLQLLHGHDFVGDAFGNHDQFDADLAREAWDELREGLLAEHIREHPGTRPVGFWAFDAPEPMRRTGTMCFKSGIGPKNPRRFDPDSREFVPDADSPQDDRIRYWRRRYPTADSRAIDLFDDAHAIYESEYVYLERLGLLTDAEQAV